ncbi:UNVERIFIED_CONTAM: Retrovirus-related Pol polyprotein from transposon TNT 1-94, partial [Sesamum radiatum]
CSSWIVDSGATRHDCPDLKHFTHYYKPVKTNKDNETKEKLAIGKLAQKHGPSTLDGLPGRPAQDLDPPSNPRSDPGFTPNSGIRAGLTGTGVTTDIKLTGDKNIDDYTPIVLLNAIPETYSDVKAAIKYGRDNVSLDTVINGLKSKEMDIKTNKTNQSTSEVNFVRGRTKNRNPDYKYRKGGRSRSRSKSRSKSRGRDERPRDDRYRDEKPRDDKYRERRCYNCGGRGHYIKDCRKPKRDNRNNSKHDGDDANLFLIAMHKVHFPASPYPNSPTSNDILDYVHADVWGPSNVETHGGNKYFLSIIDNMSRKVFVFLMKQKGEVFEKFKQWKILVENQTGRKLKVLRTDNGLEFCNQNFTDLCNEFGIKRHKTNPYTPQQNGVAERMNRTLLNKVRCLLISSGLPKFFWGEALLTAAYLVNRSPSVPLLGKTPECVWSKSDIDLSSLRIFGCAAFALVNGNKLDPRSQKCVFIGYPEGVKGYRLWVRDQPGLRVVISRNVVFNESEFPCLTKIPRTEEEYNIELTFNKVEETNEDNQQGEGFREETRDIEAGQTNRNSENPEHIDNYSLARDRERRERRIPSRFRDFHLALNSEDSEPTSYDDALKSPKSEFWIKAMKEEMKSLKDNKTWVLVPKLRTPL